jgi:hypothetical protein
MSPQLIGLIALLVANGLLALLVLVQLTDWSPCDT